jgi:hypothetical protein
MRGVSKWASRVAPLLAVFLVLGAAGAWADDAPTLPTDPPQARLGPPGGVAAQARVSPPVGLAPADDGTAQARMQPPVGTTARLQPPGGAPDRMSVFDMLMIWLQSRISIPNG